VYSIDEHFTGPSLPPPGFYYVGSIPQSAAFYTCCSVLQLYTMGTNGLAYYQRDDDLDQRDRWSLQTMIQILDVETSPWATFFSIRNSQFSVDVGIYPGYVDLGAVGSHAFPWRGPIWHTYFATGDRAGWRLYVNGDLIYNGGYAASYNPTPQPHGSVLFGDGTGGADAYWQMHYLFYNSQLDTPEPAWMGAAGLVLIALGHFGRKR
jgi:hypothetical protein